MAHVVHMSTKESVQENNILGTWCQNSNSRKGNSRKDVPDSALFPEYMATELILAQKDDIKVAS